jgi:hypothetical protein
VQKLLYALLITSHKLCHYFDEHKVTVVSDFPLGGILRNHDATGRISKWSVKLRTLNIEFTSRKAIKSQVFRCFTTDSLSRGYPGQLFGLRRMLNSMINIRDNYLY